MLNLILKAQAEKQNTILLPINQHSNKMVPNKNVEDEPQDTDSKRTVINIFKEFKADTDNNTKLSIKGTKIN